MFEAALGGNLPRNFPVVDRFANGIATSIKSIDLRAVSYLNAQKLTSTLTRYIDNVASFQGRVWAGYRVDQISGRALQVVVPAGPMSATQAAAIQGAIDYGASAGVAVSFVPF
jgi:hypothetical protein